MGNCFGKQSTKFEGEGRTLGSTPPARPVNYGTSDSTAKKSSYTPTPAGGRTLGSSTKATGNDPKSAAARAAEERAKAGQGKGKLGRQLDAQKAQTHTGTLAAASAENRAARDADAANEARAWS
ncbi:hypothetical protein AAFC00_005543 [Neodothiora populina]|uniref:Uncharacterized protein n=1 Tax=Neodothiora populina TaxID=2781224 RepID=A0ABR3PL87_9PEZI